MAIVGPYVRSRNMEIIQSEIVVPLRLPLTWGGVHTVGVTPREPQAVETRLLSTVARGSYR